MTATILLRFTLPVERTLKTKKKTSMSTPYKKANKKANGPRAGRKNADKTPLTAPTYVAPTLFIKSADKASRTASTTMNILSMGKGRNTLVNDIIAPKSAATNNRLVFCTNFNLTKHCILILKSYPK